MRKYNLREYLKQNIPVFALKRAESNRSRTLRRKPRPPEEWEVFLLLTRTRWEKWEKEGKIKKLGKRKYRITL